MHKKARRPLHALALIATTVAVTLTVSFRKDPVSSSTDGLRSQALASTSGLFRSRGSVGQKTALAITAELKTLSPQLTYALPRQSIGHPKARSVADVLGGVLGSADRDVLEQIQSACLARGISLDEVRAVPSTDWMGHRDVMFETEMAALAYTADGHLEVDVELLVKTIGLSFVRSIPIDQKMDDNFEDVRKRALLNGMVGALSRLKEERRLYRVAMTELISRSYNISYEASAEVVRQWFEEGRRTPMTEMARAELTTLRAATERHRSAEARWSLPQFRKEVRGYFSQSYPLADDIVATLRDTAEMNLSAIQTLEFWQQTLAHTKADRYVDRGLEAFTARFMVWSAYERIRHREGNEQRVKAWNADMWKKALAAEIATTDWRMPVFAQSERGQLEWDTVEDHRPVFSDKQIVAPRFIPNDAESRHIISLQDAVAVANSRGTKFIVVKDKKTKAQLKLFLRLQQIMESKFYFDDGLATGGTQETHHFATALLVNGLRADGQPEAKAFARWAVHVFEKSFPADGNFKGYKGRLQDEDGGYKRLLSLAQLDDYHFTREVFDGLLDTLNRPELMPTYGNEHWYYLLVSLAEGANHHFRVPQADLQVSPATTVREFSTSKEESYCLSKEAGVGTGGHTAFNEGVLWFFYQLYSPLPERLQSALAEVTHFVFARLRLPTYPVMRLASRLPWIDSDVASHYGLSWDHAAIITDLTVVQNFFNVLKPDEHYWFDRAKLIRLFMGRNHLVSFPTTERRFKKELANNDTIPAYLTQLADGSRDSSFDELWKEWKNNPQWWDELQTIMARLPRMAVTQGTAEMLAHGRHQITLIEDPHKSKAALHGVFGPVNDEYAISHMHYSPWDTYIIVATALPPEMSQEEINRLTFYYEPPAATVEQMDPRTIEHTFADVHARVRRQRSELLPPAPTRPKDSVLMSGNGNHDGAAFLSAM